MFAVREGPHFRISTLSDYKKLTFKDCLRNTIVNFQNRVKILVRDPLSGGGPRRLPHLPNSKSAHEYNDPYII